ncbi:hypothetical protein LTR08_000252 [Meristemomyces frigidus]|nr:hypothetical protein LTR08_000252 [Meristemomyces frigidus]
MAAYDIKQHFQGLRVETGRRKGRRDPFATGFSDDEDEKESKRTTSRGRNRSNAEKPKVAPPVQRPQALGPGGKTSILDQLRDSDEDDFLSQPTKKIDRCPSPAPAHVQLANVRTTDGAGRRGSLDKGIPHSGNRAPRSAIALAAGDLAYLDASEDETWLSSPKRIGRGPSPAPRKQSDPVDPLERSHTPKGSRVAPTIEQSQAPSQPSRHTVASPFAGTKYLEDSESSGDEAVSSRQGSTDDNAPATDLDALSPYESALAPKHPEVKRVDKAKQNGSGMSWRAFSTSRTEQRTAEIEAIQASLKQRGKSISFGTYALTDDGNRVPIPDSPRRAGSLKTALGGRGRGRARGKSPPRRASDLGPTVDEMEDGEEVVDSDRRGDVKKPISPTFSPPDIRIDNIAHS